MEDEDPSPEEIKRMMEKVDRDRLWGEISTGVPYFAGVLLFLIVLNWIAKL